MALGIRDVHPRRRDFIADLEKLVTLTGEPLPPHPTKTRIVYCRDDKRRGSYPNVKFDLLGYEFRPRAVWGTQSGQMFCGFTPAVSPSALKTMRAKVRD